jgi:hypothetical protein
MVVISRRFRADDDDDDDDDTAAALKDIIMDFLNT